MASALVLCKWNILTSCCLDWQSSAGREFAHHLTLPDRHLPWGHLAQQGKFRGSTAVLAIPAIPCPSMAKARNTGAVLNSPVSRQLRVLKDQQLSPEQPHPPFRCPQLSNEGALLFALMTPWDLTLLDSCFTIYSSCMCICPCSHPSKLLLVPSIPWSITAPPLGS